MDFVAWNTILFAFKWIFIGLIYLALLMILLAVRREMSLHMEGKQTAVSTAPGRLKVINSGSDPRLRLGALIDLLPVTLLGAQPDNDIVLADQYVSRVHARLRWDGVVWWIEDLGSRNGTYVDRVRCLPRDPRPVQPGSTIELGDMALELME